jgi:hypothetical protein
MAMLTCWHGRSSVYPSTPNRDGQEREPAADESFSARRTDFEKLQVAQVLVSSDDLARELASQVQDEGRDQEEVARAYGLQVVRHRLFRKDLGGPLAEPLASARTGELVGPVAAPQGFALVVLEERSPAELDGATQQALEDELFNAWLAGRMSQATFDLACDLACGIFKPTLVPDGSMFDWQQVTAGLFTVHYARQDCRPEHAQVAAKYRGYWFYIDNRDNDSKITFALIMVIRTRLNFVGSKKEGPVLTLPVSR